MRTVLHYFSKGMDVVERILRLLIGIAMVIMVVIIFYQVILRYVLNASNIWSEELARYLMCYSVLLGAAIAVRKYSHLQVDFVINMLPARGRCIAVSLCTLVGIGFLGFFCQYGITLCATTGHSISAGTGLPMSVAYACLPIGSVLMILMSVEVILRELVKFQELGHEKKGVQA